MRARRIPAVVALVGAFVVALSARAVESSAPVPEASGPIECDIGFDPDEPALARFGGFYENLWPNGIVAYEFVTGSTTPVRSDTLTDVIFEIPFGGPTLRSATGFHERLAPGDVLRVIGSANNDNRDMTITARFNDDGDDEWERLEVDLPPLFGFTAEDATGSTVIVFSTQSVSELNQQRFEAAMVLWEQAANVDFQRDSTQAGWLRVRNADRNSVLGDVGYGTGPRDLLMDAWGSMNSQGINLTIVHELGHSLGVKHEHQRPDRDLYVSIDTSKATDRGIANYAIDSTMTVYPPSVYDFGSVMHYWEDAFLLPDSTGPVIQVLPPNDSFWQSRIGIYDDLSEWDRRTMSFLYPENDWRFVHGATSSTVNNGGFLTPYKDFSQTYGAMPTGGRVIVPYPGSYVDPGVYSKAGLIEAPLGGVTVRAAAASPAQTEGESDAVPSVDGE